MILTIWVTDSSSLLKRTSISRIGIFRKVTHAFYIARRKRNRLTVRLWNPTSHNFKICYTRNVCYDGIFWFTGNLSFLGNNWLVQRIDIWSKFSNRSHRICRNIQDDSRDCSGWTKPWCNANWQDNANLVTNQMKFTWWVTSTRLRIWLCIIPNILIYILNWQWSWLSRVGNLASILIWRL